MSDIAVGRTVARQGAAARTQTWARGGAATGVLSIIVATIGFVLHGNPPLGKSGPALVTWAAGVDQTRFTTGIYVELLGYLLFLVFAAWLWSVLRRPGDEAAWLSMAALVGAILSMGLSAVADGLWVALLAGVHQGTAPPIALPVSVIWEVWILVVSIYLLVRPVAEMGAMPAGASAG